MNFIIYESKNYNYYTNITRDYNIYECKFLDFTYEERQQIISEAKSLYLGTNSKGASTGIVRFNIAKWNDCIAGILAEFAVANFLKQLLKDAHVTRPKVLSAIDQVDIKLQTQINTYEVEVWSSFVNNGINFALYGINRNTINKLYAYKNFFDVLGPYKQNTYKENFESIKDLYFRVLFVGKKYDVENRFIKNNEPFFIIGGMTGEDIIKLNYHKTLQASDAINITPGNYYVAPMNNIIDAKSIIQLLQTY